MTPLPVVQAAGGSAHQAGQQRPHFELGRVRAQLHIELYDAFNDVFVDW